MRMSCHKDDPGYAAFLEANLRGKVVVYLDGVVQHHAITADEEQGFVIRHATDAEGNVLINATRTATVTERVSGQVRISTVVVREQEVEASPATRMAIALQLFGPRGFLRWFGK